MSKFNENICLKYTDSSNTFHQFFAFKSEKEPVNGLLKRMLYPKKYQIPVAYIVEKGKETHKYVYGYEVPVTQEHYYGPEISAFKIKIILNNDTNEKIGPFYSNNLVGDYKLQFEQMIEQYLKVRYRDKWVSAIVMDIRDGKDEIFAKITYRDKKILIKFCNNNN